MIIRRNQRMLLRICHALILHACICRKIHTSNKVIKLVVMNHVYYDYTLVVPI